MSTTRTIDHVLLTRFNLPSEGREQRIRLEEGWLTERWGLFTKYCLPAVAAQTNQNFSWIIYFDPETPQWLREAIDEVNAPELFMPIYRATVDREQLFGDVAEATGARGDLIITTNLDNDDGLARDFVARLQSAPPDDTRRAIYLTNGLIRKGPKLYRRTDRHNAFCSVSESWDEPQGCWSNWHNLLAVDLPLIELGGTPGWLQVVHGRNVSNRVRGRLVSPSGFAADFAGLIDDIPEPTLAARLYDLTVQNLGRTFYESARAATKVVAVRIFGHRGMDATRNKLERFLGRARSSTRLQQKKHAGVSS